MGSSEAPDLEDVLGFPYFWKANDIISIFVEVANHEEWVRSSLNTWNKTYWQLSNWTKRLGKTHLDDFKYKTSETDVAAYNNNYPSEILRLIRNLEQHWSESLAARLSASNSEHSKGIFVQLYKNHGTNKCPAVEYWSSKFSHLIPAVWAARTKRHTAFEWKNTSKCLVEQMVEKLSVSCQTSLNVGLVVHRYELTLTNTTDQNPTSIVNVLVLKQDLMDKLKGMVVKTEGSDLIVSYKVTQPDNQFQTLKYKAATSNKLKSIICVFGLKAFRVTEILKRDAYLFITKEQRDKVEEFIIKAFQRKGQCKKAPLQYNHLPKKIQERVKTSGKIEIRNKIYGFTGSDGLSNYDKLQGDPLNKVLVYCNEKLKNGKLPDVPKTRIKIYPKCPNYIERVLQVQITDVDPHKFQSILVFHEQRISLFNYDRILLAAKDHCGLKDNCQTKTLRGIHMLTNDDYEEYDENEQRRQVILLIAAQTSFLQVCEQLHCLNMLTKTKIIEYEEKPVVTRKKIKRVYSLLVRENHFLEHISGQINFLVGDMGTGKSTFLRNIAADEQHIFCRLPVYFPAKDILSKITSDMSLTNLVISTVAETKFEKSCLKNFHIILLIDAIDEISTTERETFWDILEKNIEHQTTKNVEPKVTIIASSGLHLLQEIRMKFPNAGLACLRGLGCAEIIRIIKNHFTADSQVPDSFDEVAKQLLDQLSAHIDFTPLVCEILSEILIDFGSGVQAAENLYQTKESRSVEDLLEIITFKNYLRYLTEKEEVPSNKLQRYIYKDILWRMYHLTCTFHAVQTVHPNFQDMVHGFPPYGYILSTLKGFLAHEKTVRLTHRRYNNYFIDLWVSQVLSGQIMWVRKEHNEQFGSLFVERYIKSSLPLHFIEARLKLTEISSCDALDVNQVDIVEAINLYISHPRMGRLLFTALLRSKLLNMKNYVKTDVNVASIFNEEQILSAPTALFACSVRNGDTGLFRELYQNQKQYICLDTLLQKKFPSLFHLAIYRLRYDDKFTIRWKKKLLDLLVQLEKPENDLLSRRYELLLEKNDFLEGILHEDMNNTTYIEFLTNFQANFPNEYKQLVNSPDMNGTPTWWKWSDLDDVPSTILNQIEFCQMASDGKLLHTHNAIKIVSLFKTFIKASLCAMQHQPDTYVIEIGKHANSDIETAPGRNAVLARVLLDLKIIGPNIAEAFSKADSISLLDAFVECDSKTPMKIGKKEEIVRRFPHYSIQNELEPYYIAKYVADTIEKKKKSLLFERIMQTVLATDGVAFLYPVHCHLINELIAGICTNAKLPQADQYFEETEGIPSTFVVAVKTAHQNIAKLLCKYFTCKTLRQMSTYDTMCFWRSMNQYCPNIADEVFEAMVDVNYNLPLDSQLQEFIYDSDFLMETYEKFSED